MKSLVLICLFAGLILGASVIDESLKFRIDTNHSNIGFLVPIAGGLSKVSGKFPEFEMDLYYDEKEIGNSSVDVRIKAASIDTGIVQRDAHLRTADFFDVENHPLITFKSKKVVKDKNGLTVTGDFTMRGVTREISFPFQITGTSKLKDGDKQLMNVGFLATLELDRTEYGVNYQHQSVPGFIGNKIGIELNIITRAKAISDAADRTGNP